MGAFMTEQEQINCRKQKLEAKINALALEMCSAEEEFEKNDKRRRLWDAVASYFFDPKYGSVYSRKNLSMEKIDAINRAISGEKNKLGGCLVNFDPSKGVTFVQYVTKQVSISVQNLGSNISDKNGNIKALPQRAMKDAKRIIKALNEENSYIGYKVYSRKNESDFFEIAQYFTDLSEERIEAAWQSLSISVVSETYYHEDGSEASLIDDKTAEEYESNVKNALINDNLFQSFLKVLDSCWKKAKPDSDKMARSDVLPNRKKVITSGLVELLLNNGLSDLENDFFDKEVFSVLAEKKERLNQKEICKSLNIDTGKFTNIKKPLMEIIDNECLKTGIKNLLIFKS